MRAGLPILALVTMVAAAQAQSGFTDYGRKVADTLSAETDSRLKIGFEIRSRFENRTGNGFGKDPDRDYVLYRTRFSMSFTPTKWLKFSGMVQDARAPLYGPNAPSTLRDGADLQEAYVELFPGQKSGFNLIAGRSMLNYGESRLIGSPQWSNLSRTYDNVRLAWCNPRGRIEALFLSPVRIRQDDFNQPVLGERIWGVYSSFPEAIGRSVVEFYILRHDQNRIAGFSSGVVTGDSDRLGTNTVGFRVAGPLAPNWKYSLENAWQGGHVGGAAQRASAVFGSVTHHWTLGRRGLNISAEYKYASGTNDPRDATHSSTFDQLSPANHDKFGHSDLFGWRNLHTARSEVTLNWNKRLAFHAIYDNLWLASPRDGLYNSAGKVIVRSADGTAGRHVGQELDGFLTCKAGPYQFGGGYGYLFSGIVVRRLTPGASPTYAYVFSSYSF